MRERGPVPQQAGKVVPVESMNPDKDVAGHAVLTPTMSPASAPVAVDPKKGPTLEHLSEDLFAPGVPGSLNAGTLAGVRRIAIWVFLIAAITIVGATDLWGASKDEIMLVLVASAFATMIFHGSCRPRAPGGAAHHRGRDRSSCSRGCSSRSPGARSARSRSPSG